MSERPRRRATTCISRGSAARLHHAWRFVDEVNGGTKSGKALAQASRMLGVALNQFVTINYANLESGIDRFDELRRDRFLPWLRQRSARLEQRVEPTYVWVRENVRGLHVHWALHVPAELEAEFLHLLPRWITSLEERVAKKRRSSSFDPAPEAVVQVKPVKGTIGLRRYFLKGIDPKWQTQYGVTAKPQGVIDKRRSGYSRNLCPSARKRAGYRSGSVPSRVSPWHRKQRIARFGHVAVVKPSTGDVTRAAMPPLVNAGTPSSRSGANRSALT